MDRYPDIMSSPPETRPRSGKRKRDRASRRIPVKYGEARPEKTGYANNVSVDGLYLQGSCRCVGRRTTR
jgi:hypothetical protein